MMSNNSSTLSASVSNEEIKTSVTTSDVRELSGEAAGDVKPAAKSPFERRAYAYIERGYSVFPIAPGTKRPGEYSNDGGWRGMRDWERFGQRLPTDLELEVWYTWPDAGIGLTTGKLSGVIGLDRDYDTNGTDALEALIPYTPVKKKGAKGYTAFFRYNGERSCSFNIGGKRVMDVLSDGRQTLMPGTMHPDGPTYTYLTEDLLEDYDPADLPMLPADFLEQVAAVILPYQDAADTQYQAKYVAPKESGGKIHTERGIHAQYFYDLNQAALANLDAWVPRLVPTAKKTGDQQYRCIATWRNCKNANVGIVPTGIQDFGGNYGMTAASLIMYANQINFGKAVDALRACLRFGEAETITMKVGGVAIGAPLPAGTATLGGVAPAAPVLMPWQESAASVQAPASLMLPPSTSFEPAPAVPSFITNPPGMLGEIARWITATAPKSQPEFALVGAIAIASTIMARTYRSQFGNFTSLYLIVVGKSTEGKEHPQKCVRRAFDAAGLQKLAGGSGYTSAGAVYSALLTAPAHCVTIDEIGKLLKMSRGVGQANTEAALDKLIEAFGRQDGIMTPPTYSTMTAGKGAPRAETRVVHNPGITMLGATTPATFYSSLTADLVQDGFLGRCIVVQSYQPRQLMQLNAVTNTPPPRVVEWCKRVHAMGARQGDLAGALVDVPDMEPSFIDLPFTDACTPMMRKFEQELNDEKDAIEGENLDVLLGRTLEKAMKLAMIACKADSPDNLEIKPEHLDWAINYLRHYDLALVRSVRKERTENEFDAEMKQLLTYVGNAKKYVKDKKYGPLLRRGLMPRGKLLGLMKMKSRPLSELIEAATESGQLVKSPDASLLYECYFLPAD